MQAGVSFFDKMRDLAAIGFFTSKMGIRDPGYLGNSPGKWEGVPLYFKAIRARECLRTVCTTGRSL
ncbi:MAG: gluconate 2-dehydrogenase subunit 3 family protein [Mucilaginibacter sp.]|nr:gluconate 2-dehydrogenase subunit 3 family protein [Mucilaginibacter sp.]